jgi:hypothetical protein
VDGTCYQEQSIMVCPHCQTNNPDTARFCLNCGQEFAYKCSNCQTEYPLGAHFCMACGQPVLGVSAADADRLSWLTPVVPKPLVQKMLFASRSGADMDVGGVREVGVITQRAYWGKGCGTNVVAHLRKWCDQLGCAAYWDCAKLIIGSLKIA